MSNARKWLLGSLAVVALATVYVSLEVALSRSAMAEDRPAGDHWAHFDGHWSFWHEGDKRWYYTDGAHWYYYSPTGWVLYTFDKLFGLTGFERAHYRLPEPAKVVVPRHEVYHR